MSEIAKSERQITLIYNSDSVRAKKALALAQANELPIREIDLQTDGLTREQFAEIATSLNMPIETLVNQDHPYFQERFGHIELSDMDWLTLIEHNPQIFKQPIAMRGEKAILIETPTDILQL